jgi:kinesin family protein 16B
MDSHCVIRLRDGVTTLLPTAGATCTVNAMAVTEPVRLTQGSVVVLGKTNMFRFNDPSEVASLKMNASSHECKSSGENKIYRNLKKRPSFFQCLAILTS